MKLLFCRVEWDAFYDGSNKNPNFAEMSNFKKEVEEKYYGFFEKGKTKFKNEKQLCIENIDGCAGCKKDDSVKDITVVFCSSDPKRGKTYIVGCYKKATAYRKYKNDIGRPYCFVTDSAVLVPESARTFEVPRTLGSNASGYGLNRTHWYADNPKNDPGFGPFIIKVKKYINSL